jgi:hypothetical protein
VTTSKKKDRKHIKEKGGVGMMIGSGIEIQMRT